MRRSRLRVVLLVGLCAVIAPIVPVAPARAATTWTVINGGFTKDWAVTSNAMHPQRVQIGVGDTVRWRIEGFHTVSFLSGAKLPALELRQGNQVLGNPAVFFPSGGNTYDGTGFRNSGVPARFPKPFEYSLTFTKAGTYNYICLIHGPLQTGAVVVKEESTGSPATVEATAGSRRDVALKAGQAAWANYKTERQGNTVVVPMIGNPREGWSLLRFTRGPLVIRRGTTVTWTMRDPTEIHTVTFTGGQKPPEFVLIQPQPQGPPKIVFNPKAVVPTRRTTYDGRGFLNSGVLGPTGVPGAQQSFSLTFTRAGRFRYYCVVHMPVENMQSMVIVQ